VGILLTLAVVAKYAGLLFVPSVVALLGWYSLKACGWRRAVIHVAVAAVVPAVSLALALALAPDLVAGVQVTTTQRVIVEPISRLDLLSLAAHQTGLVLALGLMGLALGLAGKGARVPAVVLVGSALLPIAYHLYTTEFTSFQKHLAFSSLFIAPLAGYATARMAGSAHDAWLGSGWPSALAVCLLAFGLGLPQAQSLYGIWPDSSAMVRLLRTQVHAGSSQILAEEAEVPRYYLQDIAGAAQWHNLYWFQYTDAVGQELMGEAAYRAAIADGYFDLIVLRFGPNADLARTLAAQVQDDPRYEAFVWPASESSAYTVWRKRSA
jgi:hypothetical protein